MFRFLPTILLTAFALSGCGDIGAFDQHTDKPTPEPILIPPDIVCQWANVRSVTDGDTIRVDFEGGGPQNRAVRYIGIDTPETMHATLGTERFGREATSRNSALISGRRLCLERDVSETDRFGRLLRYIWLPDATLVNELLVSEGFAVVSTFPPDVKYTERLLAAQRAARESGSGLWAE